ncbi:MAG: carbohydrate ABC transporter permease [Alphaproteobacteria bacterium]|nr:carbohydrate ABC transporter permease [Alphaproteobacteria bacterium]
MTRSWPATLLYNVMAWSVVFVVTFPLLWMITTALKPQPELFAFPPTFLPKQPTLEYFARLLFETPFPRYFVNSVLVASATTAVVIVVATLGAHSLVRFDYPGRRLGAQAVLLTYLLPPVVLVLPLYLLMAWLGLVNTLMGLVLAYTTFALPFSLWLLRSFMASIPADLEAAALVDGAGRMGAFFDVILPQALPGIISTALFSFILAWNEYLYALILINEDAKKTLPPGVTTMLTGTFNIEWSLLMAASVMMSIPVIVAFAFLQKHLTRGFGAGAVKG